MNEIIMYLNKYKRSECFKKIRKKSEGIFIEKMERIVDINKLTNQYMLNLLIEFIVEQNDVTIFE
jgi:hypothetical protein